MKKLPKWLKIVLGGFLGLLLLGFIAVQIASESLPEGQSGPEADALAKEMMNAVNKAAWDTTGAISWNFAGSNQHLWDRERHFAQVVFDKNRVLVDLSKRTGVAYVDGEQVHGSKADKLVDKAWKSWVNDSFWLNPVVKAFDDGTSRIIVPQEDGRQALMISYASGGATPGDSYLWLLDDNARPTAWKMWVQIIPIGGLEVPWQGWTTLSTGAVVAKDHGFLQLTDIKAAASLEELVSTDPFTELL